VTTLPHICAICCTYGRTEHVVEMLESFMRQDYNGPSSLVILNTCTDQTLVFDQPRVLVVNCAVRPATMGETRNAAIEYAPDDSLVVTLDDDDVVLPNHFSNCVSGFDPSKHGWVHLGKQFYHEGTIKGIMNGSPNVFCFTKQAWLKADKYRAINCGEDRDFVGRVTAAMPGVQVKLENDEISYVYKWGQGHDVYHLSGKGDDKPGHPAGFDRSMLALKERLDSGREPKGRIELKPAWKQDYSRMAQAFIGGVKRLENSRRGKICIICLGHVGDICNVLPIAHHIFKTTGIKPMFFTSKMYGDVLDGVSYVEPVKMDLHDKDIRMAIAEAEKRCEYVLTTQVHGEGYQVERLCESYNQEAWRMAGMLPHFSDTRNFPLVFDRRDMVREQALIYSVHWKGTESVVDAPVLFNLRGGLSSPFASGEALQSAIVSTEGFPDFIDLSDIRAERIYDMLAILERGTVLVSSDTYTLHLAAACDIPVIAITNDANEPFGRPWLRTTPRCNCILNLGYSDALSRIQEIHQKIIEL
jgi:glycosyltransferase involved in cell wall biosynthesis